MSKQPNNKHCLLLFTIQFALGTAAGCTGETGDAGAEGDPPAAVRADALTASASGDVHEVFGRVLVRAGESKPFALPDVTVTLLSGNTLLSSGTSDSDGRFTLPRQLPDSYTLCLEASRIDPHCMSIALGDEALDVGEIEVRAVAPSIPGNVRLADGSPCYGSDPFFGLNYAAKLVVLNAKKKAITPVFRANRDGDFLVSPLPAKASILRASCEGASIDVPAAASATPVSLTLKNVNPHISAVWATIGGERRTVFAPGDRLQLGTEVADVDADPLKYTWKVQSGGGKVTPSASGNTAEWILPKEEGLRSLYLSVADGKGGYDLRSLHVKVAATGGSFSGNVVDADTDLPIDGASIKINGVDFGTTSVDGGFMANPVAAAGRYAISVHKPGYSLLSRVSTSEQHGVRYPLVRAQVVVFDPTTDVELVDQRPELEKSGRPPARILLPAGTLNTNAQVEASFKTIFPDDGSMPGDYEALDSSGARQSLMSYGAIFAEFRETATGKAVNVDKGKLATLRFPIEKTKATLPRSVPIWTYEEAAGLFLQEGKAVLRRDDNGSYYEGTTSHFSVINADEPIASSKCLRVRLNPGFVGGKVRLKLTWPSSYGGQQTQDPVLGSAARTPRCLTRS